MSNYDTGSRAYMQSIFNGQTPVERQNALPGQSKYYYYKPNQREDISVSDMETVDVPTADTPNPFLSGNTLNPYQSSIQNEIYNEDKSMYGKTLPSLTQSMDWGNLTNNTIGFGTSNISQNVQDVINRQNKGEFDNGQGYGVNDLKQNLNAQNCYMTFDGRNLGLYNNTGQVGNLDAQSGRDEYQSAQYQKVVNKGPIPEGTYYADQDQRQSLTLKNIALKTAEKLGINTNQKSSWSGNPVSWGTKRVWLRPDANTNTYGRDGFSIHGGWSKGSAGCIDIPWQTGKLSDYLDGCQESVPVYVKYPKKW